MSRCRSVELESKLSMAIGLSLLEDQEKNTYGDATSEMEGVSEDAE